MDLFQEKGKITLPGVLMLVTIFLFSDLGFQIWLKKWCFLKNPLFGVWLLHNVVVFSAVRRNESATRIHRSSLVWILRRTVWRFLKKIKNRTIIWSSNPAPGHIPGGNHSKGYIHPNVYCSTIYNSQDMEEMILYFKFRREDKRVSSVSGKTTALSLSWQMPGLSGKESWKEGVKGPFCSIPFPRSGAWCVACAWEAVAGRERCSGDGGKWNWDGLKRPVGALVRQRSGSSGHRGENLGDGRSGPRGKGKLRAFPLPRGEAREVEMPADVGGGPDRGKGKMHRWLPFCQEMPDPAAGQGQEHSCADFLVPTVPGGPSARKGWCCRPLLTPPGTPSSLALVSALCVCVCAHVWERPGRCDVDHLCGCLEGMAWEPRTQLLSKILLVTIDGKSTLSGILAEVMTWLV